MNKADCSCQFRVLLARLSHTYQKEGFRFKRIHFYLNSSCCSGERATSADVGNLLKSQQSQSMQMLFISVWIWGYIYELRRKNFLCSSVNLCVTYWILTISGCFELSTVYTKLTFSSPAQYSDLSSHIWLFSFLHFEGSAVPSSSCLPSLSPEKHSSEKKYTTMNSISTMEWC